MRLLPCYSLLLALLTAEDTRGQDFFQQGYGAMVTSGAFRTSKAVRHTDGTWTMRGSVSDPTTLMQLASNGNTQWVFDFNSPELWSQTVINSTTAVPGNSTIAIFEDTLIALGTGMDRRYFGLARIASDGGVEWAKRYRYDVPGPTTSYNNSSAAVQPDGSFYLIGRETTMALVMRFGSNGVLSWARALAEPNGTGIMNDITSDGAGGCYFLAGESDSFNDTSRIILGRLNSSGNLHWSRRIQTTIDGLEVTPRRLVHLSDGNLLIVAHGYGAFIGNYGILIKVSGDGAVLWANEYWEEPNDNLAFFNAMERSDGHLIVDLRLYPYGLLHLDAQGGVQEAIGYSYQYMGNSTGVLAWEETLLREDELGVIGAYFIDVNGTNQDPRTEFVWNLDAFDLHPCGSAPVNVTQSAISSSAWSVSNNTVTATAHAMVLEPMTLSGAQLAFPEVVPFCPLYVGMEEQSPGFGFELSPTSLAAGDRITYHVAQNSIVEVFDPTGRVGYRKATSAGYHQELMTGDWAKGVYVFRSMELESGQTHVVKVLIY